MHETPEGSRNAVKLLSDENNQVRQNQTHMLWVFPTSTLFKQDEHFSMGNGKNSVVLNWIGLLKGFFLRYIIPKLEKVAKSRNSILKFICLNWQLELLSVHIYKISFPRETLDITQSVKGQWPPRTHEQVFWVDIICGDRESLCWFDRINWPPTKIN